MPESLSFRGSRRLPCVPHAAPDPLAEDVKPRRKVALRILKPELAARVQAGETFRVGDRTPLFSLAERSIFASANYTGWDVAPDGTRFLMVQLASEAEGARHDLIVVENFFRELKEKVGR